ncbi:MAG: acyltransferase family protein, partial [Treponema sp.]|nr:acyltransferase family protein [Treponema sp.]
PPPPPPHFHLWYLYSLIALYVLCPVYRVFARNATEKEFRYLIIIFFSFGLCLPVIKTTLSYFDSRLNLNFWIGELVNLSGYFLSGYYFSKYPITKSGRVIFYLLAVLSFIVTIFGTSFISIKNQVPDGRLYESLLPTTFLEAVAIFLFFQHAFDGTKKTEKNIYTIAISAVSKCTFGVYLIHDFIRVFILQLGFPSDFINPLFAVPFVSIVVFFISLIIIFICRKIPLSEYII